MTRPARIDIRRLLDEYDDAGPFCAACMHHHLSTDPCRCPECGRPAAEPGAACGRAECAR